MAVRKNKGEIMVAVMSFAAATRDIPTGVVVREGQRMRADDEIVKINPQMFVPVSTDDGERLAAKAALFTQPEPVADPRVQVVEARKISEIEAEEGLGLHPAYTPNVRPGI